MSEQDTKTVARVAVRAPDFHPNTGFFSNNEVLLTYRPGWSKVGAY